MRESFHGRIYRSIFRKTGTRIRARGPEAAPRCRSNLRVETGPRDRRSKYWDTGTLSPRSFFGAFFADQKKKKEKIKMEKGENCAACCSTSRVAPYKDSSFLLLSLSFANFYNIPSIIIKNSNFKLFQIYSSNINITNTKIILLYHNSYSKNYPRYFFFFPMSFLSSSTSQIGGSLES